MGKKLRDKDLKDAGVVPVGYLPVMSKRVLDVEFDFAVDLRGLERPLRATQTLQGLVVQVDECRFNALVQLKLGRSMRTQWTAGFVQNLISGSVAYLYFEKSAPGDIIVAKVAPETVPCLDAGTGGTWYDPNAYSRKAFAATADEYVDAVTGKGLPVDHPCRVRGDVRYASMGDSPGSGAFPPVKLPCKGSPIPGIAAGAMCTLGWRAPLPNVKAPPRLQMVTGSFVFRTWLAVSPTVKNDKTQLFDYLYCAEWEVSYDTFITYTDTAGTTGPMVRTAGHSKVRQHGPGVLAGLPILDGPDANDSACIRFSRAKTPAMA